MFCHRTIVNAAYGQDDNHQNGKQGIEVVRDGLDKQGKAVFSFYKSGNGCSPGRNGGNNADRRCCRVDNISQFCPGNLVLIRNWPHDASYGQTVKVIVNKNQYAQSNGG